MSATRRASGTGEPRRHALVLGGSIAGLLTARVLADHVERVTVVERDTIPTLGQDRKGVPQSRHIHGLLARGFEIIESLFPGIAEEIAADGGHLADPGWSGQSPPRPPSPSGPLDH